MEKETALQRMLETGIIGIIRANSDEQLVDIAKALVDGGVDCIEVTMTTPNAIQGLEKIAARFGDKVVLGCGTVLDSDSAFAAINVGAEFIVSPVLDLKVIETVKKYEKIVLPGAYTPTEIYTAWSAGADMVKIFPATTLGPGYIKDLLGPFPMLKLTPTGGVELNTAAEWIRAGAVCLGAGSSLVTRAALAKSDWHTITATARQFIQTVKGTRKLISQAQSISAANH